MSTQSAVSTLYTLLLNKRDDDEAGDPTPACEAGNDYDGRMGARISSIFVILVAGSFGSLFPLISQYYSRKYSSYSSSEPPSFWSYRNLSSAFFFAAKYFGSGVIIATALIHLLQPANESLTDECLGEGWQIYPYAYGIALGSLFGTFLVELLSRRYLEKRGIEHTHGDTGLGHSYDMENYASQVHVHTHARYNEPNNNSPKLPNEGDEEHSHSYALNSAQNSGNEAANKDINDTESSHAGDAQPSDFLNKEAAETSLESIESQKNLAMQLGSIFILEFGIIFHSVFVGLSLAVSGDEFVSLYIVLVFHQMFEGLGLGTRIANAPWPRPPATNRWSLSGLWKNKWWMPWFLALAFGFTTPIAIAIGLGVRTSYPPGSKRALITNGVFDAISAGILIYTGLVELVSNEFLHSSDFKKSKTTTVLRAYFFMVLGAGLMALLGRWA